MKYLLVIFLVLVSVKSYSQEKEFQVEKAPVALNLVEIRNSLKYPETARENRIQSNVIVKLLIDKDGNVAKVSWAEGDSVFYNTVVDAAYKLKFEPAMQDNEPVRCWVSVPFKFSLGIKNKEKEMEAEAEEKNRNK